MKVLKFGGTSVGSPQKMKNVATLLTEDKEPKFVVLSAISGTTNRLQELCDLLAEGRKKVATLKVQQLHQEYIDFIEELLNSGTLRDQTREVLDEYFELLKVLSGIPYVEPLAKVILAQGELMSTRMFFAYLNQENIKAKFLDALELMFINENGEPDINKLKNKLKRAVNDEGSLIYLTQGYICTNQKGEIDNLRRGGSDYSASLFGAGLNAKEIQIWTDIDGMHNNDPRVVERTFPVSSLNFDEAAELAYFGAKILHPSSILPAQKFGIPVRILNTMDPKAVGTRISNNDTNELKAIAAKDGITAIKIKSSRMLLAYGFLTRVFQIFEKYRTSIDMITTSEVAVSLTIDDDRYLDLIVKELKSFGTVMIDKDQSIICIVGSMISDKRGIVKNIFDTLEDIPIRMISYGGSKNNVSILIDSSYKKEALSKLNEGLFADHWK